MRLYAATGTASLIGLTGLVLGLLVVLAGPPAKDLALVALFLGISGGTTVLLGLSAVRLGLHRFVRTTRAKLVLVSVVTSVLALVNVGFTAVLMFISPHDLALLAGLVTFSLGIAVFVSVAMSEPTARSMRDLVRAVRLTSSGSLDTRVQVQSTDEVGELASAFNVMAERLETSFGRERELDQARRDLMSSVSHDLRTPLSSIRVMVESINDGVVTD